MTRRTTIAARMRMLGALIGAVGVLSLRPVATSAEDAPLGTADGVERMSYDTATQRGLTAFKAGRLEEARQLFEQAHRLRPSARTWRVLGLTSVAQNRYSLARLELTEASHDQREPLNDAQRSEVDEWLHWMRTTLASVRLQRSPASALVIVDDKPIANELEEILLEAGEHHLRVQAPHFQAYSEVLHVASAEQRNLSVRLEPEPPIVQQPSAATKASPPPALEPAPSSVQDAPVWPWVVGAVGVAGALAGGTLLAFALHDRSTVTNAPDSALLSDLKKPHDRYPILLTSGVAAGAVGIACLAAATLGLSLRSPQRQEHAASARLDFGLGRVELAGQF